MNQLISTLLLLFLCFAPGAGHDAFSQEQARQTLIIYLSRTRNTEVVAALIQQHVGGKLVRLELQDPYPEDYDAIVRQVARENENGILPPLKTLIDLQEVDTLFLGFPTWGMQLPPPVKSFLAGHKFQRKTIIPFNTHGGYGVGSGFKTLKDMATGSKVLPGLSVKGGSEKDGFFLALKADRKDQIAEEVRTWLGEIGIRSER